MENNFFKSVIDADDAPVVICDLEHTIVYMNPTAVKRYEKRGGAALVGRSIKGCHNGDSNDKIEQVIAWFKKDKGNNKVYTFRNEKENKDVYMIALRNDEGELIGYYEKHEYRNIETMKLYDMEYAEKIIYKENLCLHYFNKMVLHAGGSLKLFMERYRRLYL